MFGGEGGSEGGCQRRIEVFVKIQKKIFFFWGGGASRGGPGSGGRCRSVGGGGVGGEGDVNGELKFL